MSVLVVILSLMSVKFSAPPWEVIAYSALDTGNMYRFRKKKNNLFTLKERSFKLHKISFPPTCTEKKSCSNVNERSTSITLKQ